MFNEFYNIIVRSLKLDKTLYKDNRNFSEAGIYFAISIIIINSLIGIIPNNALLNFDSLYYSEKLKVFLADGLYITEDRQTATTNNIG